MNAPFKIGSRVFRPKHQPEDTWIVTEIDEVGRRAKCCHPQVRTIQQWFDFVELRSAISSPMKFWF